MDRRQKRTGRGHARGTDLTPRHARCAAAHALRTSPSWANEVDATRDQIARWHDPVTFTPKTKVAPIQSASKRNASIQRAIISKKSELEIKRTSVAAALVKSHRAPSCDGAVVSSLRVLRSHAQLQSVALQRRRRPARPASPSSASAPGAGIAKVMLSNVA